MQRNNNTGGKNERIDWNFKLRFTLNRRFNETRPSIISSQIGLTTTVFLIVSKIASPIYERRVASTTISITMIFCMLCNAKFVAGDKNKMVIRFSLCRSLRNTHFNECLGFLSLSKWPTNHSKLPQFYRHSKPPLKAYTIHTHTYAYESSKNAWKMRKIFNRHGVCAINKNAPLVIHSKILSAGVRNTFWAAHFCISQQLLKFFFYACPSA